MAYNTVVISSGHSINCQGMSDVVNEVAEAIKVVNRVYEIVKASGKNCYKYHDTASSSSVNLANIVHFHNSHSDGVDVSVHFNANNHTNNPMGVEVCYYSNSSLASQMSKAISDASGLKNRGPKQRTGLYFLRHTNKPAILIEVCFGDSVADCQLYRNRFEAICQAIAKTLIGNINAAAPSTPNPPVNNTPAQPAPSKPSSNTQSGNAWIRALQAELNNQGFRDRNGNKLNVDGFAGSLTLSACPLVKRGAKGNITKLVQQKLGVAADGIFGGNTEAAIRAFQKNNGLSSDGIIGQNTWRKLLGL